DFHVTGVQTCALPISSAWQVDIKVFTFLLVNTLHSASGRSRNRLPEVSAPALKTSRPISRSPIVASIFSVASALLRSIDTGIACTSKRRSEERRVGQE